MEASSQKWVEERKELFSRCEVRSSGSIAGRGLFAKLNFAKAEVALRDVPIVAMQHTFSQRLTPSCQACLKAVGNLESHLQRIFSNGKVPWGELSKAASHELMTHPDLQLAQPVPCTKSGCKALFCSVRCRDYEIERGAHRVLCRDLDDENRLQKWTEFQIHARRHHECFLLAAQAYAMIICQVVYSNVAVHRAMADMLAMERKPWHLLPDSSRLHQGHRRENKLSNETRLTWMQESLNLLRASLLPAYNDPLFGLASLFSLNYYADLLGEFDLVNASIEYRNPLSSRLCRASHDCQDELHSLVSALQESGVWHKVHDIASCRYEGGTAANEVDSDMLPPFLGIGLIPAIALMNHSCDPTCEVDFEGDRVALISMLRSLTCGEELTISYIDEDLPLQERQILLRDEYGFSCACIRCRIDAAACLLQRRSGTAAVDSIAAVAHVAQADVARLLGAATTTGSGSPVGSVPQHAGRSRSRSRCRPTTMR